MRTVERETDRILAHLRNLILDKGFTQREIQEVLGWGQSYISQLLTKQKGLRVEQLLLVLNVINIKAADFFGEIYQLGRHGDQTASPFPAAEEVERLGALLEALVAVLKGKQLIDADDLDAAIGKRARA